MTFADGLALVAIVLSLFAIFFLGVLFYKWQSDLARDVHSVLAEIRGRTSHTQEELQTVVKLALRTVEEERVSIGGEFGVRMEAVEKQLTRLQARMSAAGDKEYEKLIEQVRQETGRLASDVAELKQKRPIAAHKDAARDAVAGILSVAEQAEIESLLGVLSTGAGDAAYLVWRYGDAFKAADRGGLIELDLAGDRPGGSVRLTDGGRAFLAKGSRTKDGAAE